VPPGRRSAFQNGRLGVTALCLQDQRKGTMERRGFGHTHREIAGIGQGARYTREQRSGNRGCGLAAFRRKSKRECSGEKSGAMNQLECVPMQTWISRFMLSAFVYSLLQGQANPVLKPVAHAPSILVQPQFLCSVQAPYGEWDTLAQFISGLNSSAYSLPADQKAAWAMHAELANSSWANAQTRYLDPVDRWRERTLENGRTTDLAFYPFSGPDAANVLSFFPDAREYLLIGLEPVGCIPAGLADYTASYFSALRRSLEAILSVNFFRTNDMQLDFNRANLRGVLPALLFLVARSGYSVLDVTRVAITPAGSIARSMHDVTGETSGVAIRFTNGHRNVRELYYFSLNLRDYRLRQKPGTMKYLASLPEADTLIKSASYLLHTPYFSFVRDTILSKSRRIVEDDSGIPFRFFDPSAWDVHLYGAYTAPIDLFRNRRQGDLELAFASRRDVGPLGFAIGYHHVKESNLLVATHRGR
jgi:hypothetical protein